MATTTSDPSKCVVLVPVGGQIEPACEAALLGLERRGYPVWRVRGYANIDQARNEMVTAALAEGFEETMWIDSDISFDPQAVAQLRSHGLPIVCGIYVLKGQRGLACQVLPHTRQIVFGAQGGLIEVHYAGTGFLHVRRQVYFDIRERMRLPLCNARIGRPSVPYFLPMVVSDDNDHAYLIDDFAFCHRARQCDYRIMADTTIRLWHHGTYGYSWEDAGLTRQTFATFRFEVTD